MSFIIRLISLPFRVFYSFFLSLEKNRYYRFFHDCFFLVSKIKSCIFFLMQKIPVYRLDNWLGTSYLSICFTIYLIRQTGRGINQVYYLIIYGNKRFRSLTTTILMMIIIIIMIILMFLINKEKTNL